MPRPTAASIHRTLGATLDFHHGLLVKIFLTGATGYLGSAVLSALVRDGHTVTALVRSAQKAADVAAAGGLPVEGDLGAPATYRDAAVGHDGYIHAAVEASDRKVDLDRSAIETLAELAAQAPRRVLIYTSGVWVLGDTAAPADEAAPLRPTALVTWRPIHEADVLASAERGVRAIVVRPGIVFGGRRGIVGDLFRDAVQGRVRLVGDGQNHWPLVYDRDLGALYALLVSRGEAAGIIHVNDEGDERAADVAAAITAVVPGEPAVELQPLADARAELGDYASALALDQVVRSPRARALGWTPTMQTVGRHTATLYAEWKQTRAI